MFRCPSTTLPISRLSFALPAGQPGRSGRRLAGPLAACFAAAALVASSPVFGQSVGVKPAQLTTGAPAADIAPEAASGTQATSSDTSGNDFDARQKALNSRTDENNYRYAVAQHNCYSTFFVNHCIGKARDAMREVAADIRKQQLALDDEQRVQRAQQRDQQDAIKRARNEAEAPQRASDEARNAQAYQDKQRQHELDQAQRNAEAPQRAANEQAFQDKQRQHAIDQAQRGISPSQAAANQKAYDQKQSDYQKKLDEARQQGAQKAQQRVENTQRYQQKQADAAQHKADVEARQKQAAEKAAEKQKQQEEALKQQQLQQQQMKQQGQ